MKTTTCFIFLVIAVAHVWLHDVKADIVYGNLAREYYSQTVTLPSEFSNLAIMNGYESCLECTFENTVPVFCHGSLSCVSSVFSDTERLTCRGFKSCVTQFNSVTQLRCEGVSACTFSEFSLQSGTSSSSDQELLCYALFSCAESQFIITDSGEWNIRSSAPLGLYNSRITSSGTGAIINFRFDAFLSGAGLLIECLSGDTCNIECDSSHSCYQIEFDCESGATCNVLCDQDNGVWCPLSTTGSTYNSGYNYDDFDYSAELECWYETFVNEWYIDWYIALRDGDEYEACGLYAPDCCHDYQQCQDIDDITAADVDTDNYGHDLCFTGSESGQNSIINIGDQSEAYDIRCDGYLSCLNTEMDVRDNAFGFDIYCNGRESCRRNTAIGGIIELKDARTVVCGGSQACTGRLFSNLDTLYCLGLGSCREAEITNVFDIYVYGYSALFWGVINSPNNGNPRARPLRVFINSGVFDTTDEYKLEINCFGRDSCFIYCYDDNCQENVICQGPGDCVFFEASGNYNWLPTHTCDGSDYSPVRACENSPCRVWEAGLCYIYHGRCNQCHTGTFRFSTSYPCVDCETFFGDDCDGCNTGVGCGQCTTNTFTLVEDTTTNFWYCEPSPCFYPENNCRVCNNGQCSQCDSGYTLRNGNCV